MEKFAFISRHQPTPEQVELAADRWISLIPVGDADAFTVKPEVAKGYAGVVVVHPAAALRLAPHTKVGVFENANRAPEGAPVSFKAVALHVYDLRPPSDPYDD